MFNIFNQCNENVDIQLGAYDALRELTSSGTHKVERLKDKYLSLLKK